MKISYNWLKQYLDIDIEPGQLSSVLTNTGLEVEALEEFCPVKGGLKGCVIGEVKTKIKHPNADSLSLTTVDIGREALLHIVCGAPNVEAGQKVVVATIGAKLYGSKGELEIKAAKIRGEVSEGMICSEDELGFGDSHAGIMVLEPTAKTGTPASEYFNIETDWVFEIGLTPNRNDAMSHLGVARDIAAALTCLYNKDYTVKKPSLDIFNIDNTNLPIEVIVEDAKACPRYAGITVANVKVEPSPAWLQNRLKSIGLRPINNVVDITNYVLFETGQPLHAFDADKITGKKVIVKKLAEGTKFVTLDEAERSLLADDLMICNAEEGMCIAGVFGGTKSGVTDATRNIFIESAYFDPVHVRKTSKHHGLKTDASFRFERSVDPDMVIFALKRAAMLIQEIGGGKISSVIVDVYPHPIGYLNLSVTYANINRLIGKSIPHDVIKKILLSLDLLIKSETETGLHISVPPFKADVTREVDVIEEILRIYGYNNVGNPEKVSISPSKTPKPDKEKIQNTISNFLSSCGFSEIMNNSLTKASYLEGLTSFHPENNVGIMNPLSSDLSVMRQTLLLGGLESILYNINRKNAHLKFYEFGKVYNYNAQAAPAGNLAAYSEKEQLALFITGNLTPESWHNTDAMPASLWYLKAYMNNIFKRAGIETNGLAGETISNDILGGGVQYFHNGKMLATYGCVAKAILKKLDIGQEVFYGVIEWDVFVEMAGKINIQFNDIPRFPEVRRDLALLIDKNIFYKDIEQLAYKTIPNTLRQVNLFDVYEDEKIGHDKKSYAVSFVFLDMEKTMTDAVTEKLMEKLKTAFTKTFNAVIR